MRTVSDIFRTIPAMQREGLNPPQIADRIENVGQASGLAGIEKIISGAGLRPISINLVFLITGEVIYFDGTDWHHRRP
jgi:hypothetical protein